MSAKQQEIIFILKETVGEDPREPNKPTLVYTMLADAVPYATGDEALKFLKKHNLPLGWVRKSFKVPAASGHCNQCRTEDTCVNNNFTMCPDKIMQKKPDSWTLEEIYQALGHAGMESKIDREDILGFLLADHGTYVKKPLSLLKTTA